MKNDYFFYLMQSTVNYNVTIDAKSSKILLIINT